MTKMQNLLLLLRLLCWKLTYQLVWPYSSLQVNRQVWAGFV